MCVCVYTGLVRFCRLFFWTNFLTIHIKHTFLWHVGHGQKGRKRVERGGHGAAYRNALRKATIGLPVLRFLNLFFSVSGPGHPA